VLPDITGIKILLAEDDDDLRAILTEALKKRGAFVTSAAGGDEAFVEFQQGGFQVVLSDMRMPKGNGLELAQRISGSNLKRPLVMIFSGYNDLTQEQCLAAGISRVLAKPMKIATLVEVITAELDSLALKQNAVLLPQ
jgi:two-component system, NarL family, capsular synthesis sensor histidine kinase RcsC